MIVRGLKRRVGDQHDRNLVAAFDLGDFLTLFVEDVGRNINGHLSVQRTRAFLGGLLLQNAQHLQGAAFGVADDADAVAARAGDVASFGKRRTQSLARKFHQTKAADLSDLHAGAVGADGFLQALLDLRLVLALAHVDEVDHDEAAQVAQAHLARHFVGRFKVRAQGRFLDVGAARGASRVHVHGNERFGVVDHDRAARGQGNRTRVGGLDLVLDLKARKERRFVAVALHARHHVGHHVRHELAGLIVDVVGINEDFTDVGLEVVADGANDEIAFLNNQERRRIGALQGLAVAHRLGRVVANRAALVVDGVLVLGSSGFADGAPELEKVVEVPLELFNRAADARRAGDRAHACGEVELIHRFAQFLTLFTLDAARDAASARVVGHQNEITAGEADEGRQRGTLVAAFFLFDLNDQLLPFGDALRGSWPYGRRRLP